MNETRLNVFEINGIKVNSNLKFDRDKFDKIYAGGITEESNDFGYSFVQECADFASQLVNKKTHSLEDASTLLGDAIFSLKNAHIAYAIGVYCKKIEAINNPEFIDLNNKLTIESKKDIFLGMKKSDNFKLNTVIKALSGKLNFLPATNYDINPILELTSIAQNPKPLNSRIDMAEDGSVRIYNDKNQLHAQGIPAVTMADGTQQWFLEGIETTKSLNKKQVLNNLRDIHVPRIGHKKRT